MTPNSDTATAAAGRPFGEPDGAANAPSVRDARTAAPRADAITVTVGTTLSEAQRQMIVATLRHFGGDKRRAAATLGISLKTLYNRLALYRGGPASG